MEGGGDDPVAGLRIRQVGVDREHLGVLGRSMVREVATTAQPRFRYPATMPAPMPCEAPVMMATF